MEDALAKIAVMEDALARIAVTQEPSE